MGAWIQIESVSYIPAWVLLLFGKCSNHWGWQLTSLTSNTPADSPLHWHLLLNHKSGSRTVGMKNMASKLSLSCGTIIRFHSSMVSFKWKCCKHEEEVRQNLEMRNDPAHVTIQIMETFFLQQTFWIFRILRWETSFAGGPSRNHRGLPPQAVDKRLTC